MRKSLVLMVLFFGLWAGVGAQTPEPVVITDLSWSPDGRYVAVGTGYWDETLSLCSYAGDTNIVFIDSVNQRLKTIRREEFCTPVGVSFSPDGSKLAIVTENAEIWDMQTERWISGYTIAASFVGVSWNPSNASLLILLVVYNEIYFTPPDLTLDRTALIQSDLPYPARFVYGAWSGDGVQVATVTDDGRIHIWTPDQTTLDQTITLTFEGHAAPVKRLAWNPVSGLIASGDDAGNIFIWNLETGETVRHLTGHDGIVYDVAWSPDGQQLASAGADGTLRVWDGSTHRNKIIASGDIFTAVSYSPDGSQLAYGGAVGEVLELTDVVIIPAPKFEPIPTPTPPVSDS